MRPKPNALNFACLLGLLLCGDLARSAAQSPSVRIVVKPENPLIEQGRSAQRLNFDFILKNGGPTAQHLNRIQVSVIDRSGKLVLRRALDENGGSSAGISTVGQRDVPPHQEISIFNPFFSIDNTVAIGRMVFEFFFNDAGTEMVSPLDFQSSREVIVVPKAFKDDVQSQLPLKGRAFVFDGHGFYAHHRRLDLAESSEGPNLISSNSLRYAYDLCPVDASGDMYHNGPYDKTHWYGYGTPIYAPSDGVITEAQNAVPENEYKGKQAIHPQIADIASTVFGNHIVLNQGHGEFILFGHMQTGSLRVVKGTRVKRGQLLGRIGFSGDAFIPHLHMMRMDSPDFLHAEGLPIYFQDFRRIVGAKTIYVRQGTIDTGEIVESGRQSKLPSSESR